MKDPGCSDKALQVLEEEVVVTDKIGGDPLFNTNLRKKALVGTVIAGNSFIEVIKLEKYAHLVERSTCAN